MIRLFFLSAFLLMLCGCSTQQWYPWSYNVGLQQDALKAAEFEQMNTDVYRERVEQNQKNMFINTLKNNNINYRRYW